MHKIIYIISSISKKQAKSLHLMGSVGIITASETGNAGNYPDAKELSGSAGRGTLCEFTF